MARVAWTDLKWSSVDGGGENECTHENFVSSTDHWRYCIDTEILVDVGLIKACEWKSKKIKIFSTWHVASTSDVPETIIKRGMSSTVL